MSKTPVTIVIVDDDDNVRHALGNLLRSADFDVRAFASAEAFLDSPDGEQVGCLIADINLPGMSGVALLETLAASGRVIPSVLITARDDGATLTLARRAGSVPHLRKPFSDEELFDALDRVLLR
ncbi:MAG: putative transcriptional regulator ycf27 OmpR-like protein [Gemmatimonadetes bacterium]|nr:putative transcriptional regulator ycf27 OmpR-like protein [Gemmatimonadota bacterium]